MNTRLRLATALACLSSGAVILAQDTQRPATPPPAPPAPPIIQGPTFRSQVEYVEVDVLVTDAEGRPVPGLTKNDLQVFEDGKLQNITSFEFVNIPVERPDRPLFQPNALEPDTASNERPFSGRTYVLVLDDLHTNALRSQLVKNAAKQFIQRNLGANDLMAVVYTGGRAGNNQGFTNNRRLLMESVDKFIGQKLQSAALNRSDQYIRSGAETGLFGGALVDPDDLERAFKARNTLATIKNVAEWFGGVRGRRKTMLFFSEGIDYDINDIMRGPSQPGGQATAVMDDTREAIAAATRANVSIYGVDPRGLTLAGDDTITTSNLIAGELNPSGGMGMNRFTNELRLSQNSLRTLSDETGGVAAVNSNMFDQAFDRIVSDNSSYYLLAYYPTSPQRNGKFHRIEVKTSRPGLSVRARRGYQFPKAKAPAAAPAARPGQPSADITEVLNSPIQVSGLGMRMFAAPFKDVAPNASVLVGIELVGRDLALVQDGKIEVSYFAFDAEGKSRGGSTDSLTTKLRPETKTRVEQSGFRLLNRLQLAPGRYHLRVAAHDPIRKASGSVTYDIEVPDFNKMPFSMSGVIMTSMSGSSMVTAKADQQLNDVLPASPIATRTFPQNDEIALFAEIYDNQAATPHRVDISATIRTDEGQTLYETKEERNSTELAGTRGGYGFTTRIPLNEIPPGDYVLNVQATSRLGNDVGVGRQVRITVVPPTAAPPVPER
jgi:VWFA-related protein